MSAHALLVCGFVAIAAAAGAQCPNGSPPPCAPRATVPAKNSVAVLYFERATLDTVDAYVASGLTEAIIVRLSAVERLQVKSIGVVRQLRRQGLKDPSVVGKQLGVAHLVNGSVRHVGGHLRVTVELVRTSDGVQLWAQQFDRPDADLLALEQGIAESVAAGIAGKLLPVERAALARRPTVMPEAYNQFLRGNYLLAQRTADAFARALLAYERAARIDTAFVAPLAQIAYTYALAVGWDYVVGGIATDSLIALGHASVRRALRADSTAGDAWMASALLRSHDPHYSSIEVLAAIDHAQRHNPRSPEVYHIRGWYYLLLAQDSLARDAFQRALDLEPERAVTLYYLARAHHLARRYPECIAMADSALRLDPAFGPAFFARSACRAEAGDILRARADANEAARLASGGGPEALAAAQIAYLDRRVGDTTAVRRRLSLAATRSGTRGSEMSDAYHLGAMHALLGERDLAVAALAPIKRRPGTWRMELRQPMWDMMRDYAPFAALLAELDQAKR